MVPQWVIDESLLNGSQGELRNHVWLSDSPSVDRQTALPHRGSSHAARMWVGGCVGGWCGWIILPVQSRVPAAPSRSQRHHEDSVDNEQSLWCVLQGPVKAEPGNSNEAQTSVWSRTHIQRYESTTIVLHSHFFFSPLSQRFDKISHIILDLILIMEIRDWAALCISFKKDI